MLIMGIKKGAKTLWASKEPPHTMFYPGGYYILLMMLWSTYTLYKTHQLFIGSISNHIHYWQIIFWCEDQNFPFSTENRIFGYYRNRNRAHVCIIHQEPFTLYVIIQYKYVVMISYSQIFYNLHFCLTIQYCISMY